MTDVTQGVKSVLEAMLKSGDLEGQALYAHIYNDPMIEKARGAAQAHNPEGFFYALGYPLQKLVDAVVTSEFPSNQNAQFLMANSRFIENHLDNIFSRFEGSPCSHDKTKTVIRAVMRFFTTQKPIEFDYTQEYTFHLPRKVLKDHDSIISFITGLHYLHYGNPDRYLVAMQNLLAQVAAAKAAEKTE